MAKERGKGDGREELAALMRRAQAGDRAAFEELYRRTAQAQYFTIVGRVGEGPAADILQETYLVAWKNREKIRAGAVLGYLSATARNLCMQHFQQLARRADVPVTDAVGAGAPAVPGADESWDGAGAAEVSVAPDADDECGHGTARGSLVAQGSAAEAADPAGRLTAAEQRERLARALMEDLSDRERDMVLMRYYLDMKVGAIAEALDVSRNTVRNVLNQALATLRRKVAALPAGAGLSAALAEAVEARMAPGAARRVLTQGSWLQWGTRVVAAVTVLAAVGALGFAATWEPPESVADEPVPLVEPEPEPSAVAPQPSGPGLVSSDVVDGLLELSVRDAAGVAEAWCVADDGTVYRPVSSESEGGAPTSLWRFQVPSGTYEVHLVGNAGSESVGTVTAEVLPIYPAPTGEA